MVKYLIQIYFEFLFCTATTLKEFYFHFRFKYNSNIQHE